MRSGRPSCRGSSVPAAVAGLIILLGGVRQGARGFAVLGPQPLVVRRHAGAAADIGSSSSSSPSCRRDRPAHSRARSCAVDHVALRLSRKAYGTENDPTTTEVPSSSSAAAPRSTRPRSWLSDRSVPRAVAVSLLAINAAALWSRRPAWAGGSNNKSRSDGYAVQKTDDEWKDTLSPMQHFVLREGGTERPYYSILEMEDRPGSFVCAGCNTPLFSSKDKFHSGTGWPSFARALPGVEIQTVDPISLRLLGAELRCRTCGGHLGDVFSDGFLFVGTEAEKTGQRYCIDGAALVFYPATIGAGAGEPAGEKLQVLPVRGDTMSPLAKRKRKK